MAVHAPQKEAFDIATKHQNQLQKLEIISSFLTILFTILAFFSFYTFIEGFINVLSIILLIAVLYLKTRFLLSYREAESIRRDSLIDNSFDTKLAETEAIEYYNNAEMTTALHKLLASTHESSIFSLAIVNRMLRKQNLINLIVGIFLLVACAVSSIHSKIFLALFNGFMSLNMISSFVELCFLRAEINTVINNCKGICENHLSDASNTLTVTAQAHIIRECLRYEAALSYASVLFDESTYHKLNKSHTNKWKKIKERYYK